MPPRLRRTVEALRSATVAAPCDGAGPLVDATVLTTVAQACRDDERLQVSYTARDGAHTSRVLEPHRLVSLGRRWYLVAYDLSRHDWRSFRVDRLGDVAREGTAFRPRKLPAENAAAFVRSGIRDAPTAYEVHAVVHAPAEQVRARLGRWAHVEEVDVDCCRLRMRTDTLDWAALALGSVAADVSSVGPPELVDQLRSWADRFARATASLG